MTSRCSDIASAMRLNSGQPASERRERVKPQLALIRGVEAGATIADIQTTAATEQLLPLNPANRRIRTRMSGGVGGEEPRGSPLSRLPHGTWWQRKRKAASYPLAAEYWGRHALQLQVRATAKRFKMIPACPGRPPRGRGLGPTPAVGARLKTAYPQSRTMAETSRNHISSEMALQYHRTRHCS